MTIISIDAMGGDIGPDVTIPAAIEALKSDPELSIILVGDQDKLKQYISNAITNTTNSDVAERLSIEHASQVVAMDESPALALKKKKDSSMRVAINLVKEGRADAAVSAGNTGALMATH